MMAGNLRSALIAGVIAAILYFIFSALFAEASIGTALIYGVGTFIVALIITILISNYTKTNALTSYLNSGI